MFENIGKKICGLTEILFLIGAFVSVGFGVCVILVYERPIVGLLAAVIGILLNWVSSFLLYGFGRLIQTNEEIAENTDAAYGLLNDILFQLKCSELNKEQK